MSAAWREVGVQLRVGDRVVRVAIEVNTDDCPAVPFAWKVEPESGRVEVLYEFDKPLETEPVRGQR